MHHSLRALARERSACTARSVGEKGRRPIDDPADRAIVPSLAGILMLLETCSRSSPGVTDFSPQNDGMRERSRSKREGKNRELATLFTSLSALVPAGSDGKGHTVVLSFVHELRRFRSVSAPDDQKEPNSSSKRYASIIFILMVNVRAFVDPMRVYDECMCVCTFFGFQLSFFSFIDPMQVWLSAFHRRVLHPIFSFIHHYCLTTLKSSTTAAPWLDRLIGCFASHACEVSFNNYHIHKKGPCKSWNRLV